MKINVTNDTRCICRAFANNVVSTNIDRYAARNQKDISKIIDDIYIGKLAEYAAYNLLNERSIRVAEPDTEIYSARDKSFSADLCDGKNYYHVKCMKKSTAERFGLSWSFQVEDSLIKRPLEQDFIVLCEYDDTLDNIDIKHIIKANKVLQLYTHPKLMKLRGIKKVLMWEDVQREYSFKKKG
jgi:hypothetical protein